MHRIIICLLAAALMSACNTGGRTGAEATGQEQAAPAEWAEVTLDVGGMTCEGCENAIKANVENLEGIASVESSFEEGWTRVRYDGNLTSRAEIEAKIADTGYEVLGEKR